MPELPEVEVARKGIAPGITGHTVTDVVIREPRLRWRVESSVHSAVGCVIRSVGRRGKYLILDCGIGSIIVHLGMSGSLRLMSSQDAPARHDHVDVVLGGRLLRLCDPRRFGAVLWCAGPAERHPLLAHLGVEPLVRKFDAGYLFRASRDRRVAIKQFLMNARHIVGIGNIYASESLFLAGIHPALPAWRISRAQCEALVRAIKRTLRTAIDAGGSSLRDFVSSDGHLGCFQTQCYVYDRENEPCRRCATPIRRDVQGQRSTFYCPHCQERRGAARVRLTPRAPSRQDAPAPRDGQISTHPRRGARSRARASRR